MPTKPLNWSNFQATYNDKVMNDLNEAFRWLIAECPTSKIENPNKFKYTLKDEVIKLKNEQSSHRLTFAIYKLYLDGFIPDPLNLQFDDVNNALWAIQDKLYSFPTSPPDTRLLNIDLSPYQI